MNKYRIRELTGNTWQKYQQNFKLMKYLFEECNSLYLNLSFQLSEI